MIFELWEAEAQASYGWVSIYFKHNRPYGTYLTKENLSWMRGLKEECAELALEEAFWFAQSWPFLGDAFVDDHFSLFPTVVFLLFFLHFILFSLFLFFFHIH